MPAAPFSEACGARPTRQCDIDPEQCRWIIADEAAGAEALMCGAPAERRRPFCAAHCDCAYIKPPPEDVEAMAEEAEPERDADEEAEEESE